jgi:hypothetical protein
MYKSLLHPFLSLSLSHFDLQHSELILLFTPLGLGLVRFARELRRD